MKARRNPFKGVLFLSIVILSVIALASCNLITSGKGDDDTITLDKSVDLQELDMQIIESLYPKGMKASLDEAAALVQTATSRNSFDPTKYEDSLGWSLAENWKSMAGWMITEELIDDSGNNILKNTSGEKIYSYWSEEEQGYCYVYDDGLYVYKLDGGGAIFFIDTNDGRVWKDRSENVIEINSETNEYATSNDIVVDARTDEPADLSTVFDNFEIERAATPEEAYDNGPTSHRFPEDVEKYLDRKGLDQDPSMVGDYFIMEEDSFDMFKITYTIKFNNLSSLDKVVTVYYVTGDSWTPYSDSKNKLKESDTGWASETVYYNDGSEGVKTKLDLSALGITDTRGLFIADTFNIFAEPSADYDIFDLSEVEWESIKNNQDNSLDIYVDEKIIENWDSNSNATYNSVTTTEVSNADKTTSYQYEFYTEMPNGTGTVKAGLTTFVKEDNSKIVNANSRYYDITSNFVNDDVQTLEFYPDTDDEEIFYNYIYHHKYFSKSSNSWVYNNNFSYYDSDTIADMRIKQEDSGPDKLIENELTLSGGNWTGELALKNDDVFETGTVVNLDITLNAGDKYLTYSGAYNGIEIEIVANENGEVYQELFAGIVDGTISADGSFRGIYKPFLYEGGVQLFYDDDPEDPKFDTSAIVGF